MEEERKGGRKCYMYNGNIVNHSFIKDQSCVYISTQISFVDIDFIYLTPQK